MVEHAARGLDWRHDGTPMPWMEVRRGPLLTIGALDGDHYSIGMAVYPADASVNRLRVTLARVDWVKPPDTPQTRVRRIVEEVAARATPPPPRGPDHPAMAALLAHATH